MGIGIQLRLPTSCAQGCHLNGSQAFRLQPISAAEFEEFSKKLDKINLDVGSEYLKDLRSPGQIWKE
jgi:hypothetical protein